MKTILLAAAAFAGIAAAPAGAVTWTAVNGSSSVFAGSAVGAQVTFDAPAASGFTVTGGNTRSGSLANVGANPLGAPDTNTFFYVTAGNVASVTARGAYQAISFYMGSIDAGNTVEVLGQGGAVLASYTGSQLAMPMAASGSQTDSATNRLLTFTAEAGQVLTGLRFSSSVNSLEADNVRFTAAVPEPATWAMLLVGFGMVGGAARYRRRSAAVRFA